MKRNVLAVQPAKEEARTAKMQGTPTLGCQLKPKMLSQNLIICPEMFYDIIKHKKKSNWSNNYNNYIGSSKKYKGKSNLNFIAQYTIDTFFWGLHLL